jgi:IS4 transposase
MIYLAGLRPGPGGRVNRGDVQRRFFDGADFDTLIEDEVLVLQGRAVDASVTVGSGSNVLALRLVGVESSKGYCWYLTNIAGRYGPHQIASLYRVRWEIELSMKLDKSVHHLSASGENVGRNIQAVRALLHAALIASVIAGLIAHRYNHAVA